jgi:hypothetical protein
MVENKVKFSSIVESQLPRFVREDFPLIGEFLSQYYRSLEYKSAPIDLIRNIDNYIKLDNVTNLVDSTVLTQDVEFSDIEINVESTEGFPDNYGLLLINSEVITYESKTDTSFLNCSRGFSGTTSYDNLSRIDSLVFSLSSTEEHSSGDIVENLNIKFLKIFLTKLKKQFSPGFEGFELSDNLNQNNFIKQSRDFYSSKGSERSFEILFKALYGVEAKVIRPSEQLLIPSDGDWRTTLDLVVEPFVGDPLQMINKTLIQYEDDQETTKASGTVNNVQEFLRDDKKYYVLSLDYGNSKDISNIRGSVFGEFTIHPSTTTTSNIFLGDTYLDVDSTVGFPESGTLTIEFDNLDLGRDYIVLNYTSKSLTQFFGIDPITRSFPENTIVRKIEDYVLGTDDSGDDILMVATGVLSDVEFLNQTGNLEKGDIGLIQTLGIDYFDTRSNNFLYNIPIRCDISQLIDNGNLRYEIITTELFQVNPGDFVDLTCLVSLPDGSQQRITKEFQVLRGSTPNNSFRVVNNFPIIDAYSVTKKIIKARDTLYNANVQNTYVDYEDSIYVASSSLPNYFNEQLTNTVKEVLVSGLFNSNTTFTSLSDHKFINGESVVFISLSEGNDIDIQNINYFVKIDDQKTFRLSSSLPNLYNNIFISFTGVIELGKFISREYLSDSLQVKELKPQNIIRKIGFPKDVTESQSILPNEKIGILNNGVELITYKSNDFIYYGPLNRVEVLSEGINYDLVSPPNIIINDSVGSDASVYCSSMEGELIRIDILNTGFDYLEVPKITIDGGNSEGCVCEPELITINHVEYFDTSFNVDTVNNTISFKESHKFRDSEEVIYNDNGNTSIEGLVSSSSYYVSVVNSKTIRLHVSYNDSQRRVNEVQLISSGNNIQSFTAAEGKSIINSIKIVSSSPFFYNKKIVKPENVNILENKIFSEKHNFNSGDEVTYFVENGTPISGLSTSQTYYITSVDENNFRLSLKNVDNEFSEFGEKFFYETQQFVKFHGIGSGKHIFKYPDIKVNINGIVGVSTIAEGDYTAKLIPIIRGSIQEVSLENAGVGYGSSEILNYHRKPSIRVATGSGAQITPVISETSEFVGFSTGRIVDVVVNSFGFGYTYGSFDLKINTSTGIGAILQPVLNEQTGSIIDVIVISGGVNYRPEDTIQVVNVSESVFFDPIVKSWNVNNFQKKIFKDEIASDDGILLSSKIKDDELQYTHLYPARKLRDLVYASKLEDGSIRYRTDLENDNVDSPFHSPILGWAYDGNPIYGSYAYDRPNGGRIRQMVSGYELRSSTDRPSSYPLGFFVEDYVYTGNGDLDEYNGRFCITPEYPNGVYAYFSPLSNTKLNSRNTFDRFKVPVFPYALGPQFRNKREEFNYDVLSNQLDIDLNETNWRRNVYPLNLNKLTTFYDYVIDPDEIKPQLSSVQSTIRDKINSINVVSAGSSYRVGDIVLLNNNFEESFIYGEVTDVVGQSIVSIASTEFNLLNIELEKSDIVPSGFIGVCSQPHNLDDFDFIKISGFSTSISKSIDDVQTIATYSNELILRSYVDDPSITGIITYFNVTSTDIKDILLRENDVYQIETERVKVLKVDSNDNRIKVLRNYNNTVGTSHSQYLKLEELSRKFRVKYEESDLNNLFKSNREFYFDPIESVGLGTTGVSRLSIINPGSGSTQVSVPSGLIYINEHKLQTNDRVTYKTNGSDPLQVSINGVSQNLNDIDDLYTIAINNNYIGLSTVKVGITSSNILQNYVGLTTTYFPIYFTGIGTGNNHSFVTDYENKFIVESKKREIIVSTEERHNLLTSDFINISVTPNLVSNIKVKYNDFNRRLILDPVGFNSTDVYLTDNVIFIEDHNLDNGQKVIHISDIPCDGLENNGIYYVFKISDNKVALCTSYFDTDPIYGSYNKVVNITSKSYGELYKVNPKIKTIRNNKIVFDLSDSSLSFIQGSVLKSAFDFDIYTDSKYRNKFISSKVSPTFEVRKFGSIGISNNARYELTLSNGDDIPNELYYKLTPVKNSVLSTSKSEYFIDDETIEDPGKIELYSSTYGGSFTVTGIGSTFFSYFNYTNNKYEPTLYTKNNSNLSYTTSSKNTLGGISNVSITQYGNYDFVSLPYIYEIISENGTNAIVEASTNNIGKVFKVKIEDIGFAYSCDKTLRPTVKFPYIATIDLNYTLDEVQVIGLGTNYTIFPNLLVKDSVTNEIVDAKLEYISETNEIKILKNVFNISNVPPKIIPVNNTNGFSIKDIVYDQVTKLVTITFNTSFSSLDDFPFLVGDKFLIENCITTELGSEGKGFNSSDYNYEFFEVLSADPNIGGSNATIIYSVSRFVTENETLGTYDNTIATGLIIPEKYFPVFNIFIKTQDFIEGEFIKSSFSGGKVLGRIERWYPEIRTAKILTRDQLSFGDTIEGLSSSTVANIINVRENSGVYIISASSPVEKGWNSDYGRLNDTLQRIQDSDYYQYFSYSIKSPITFEDWNDAVSSLNHTSGFKKFSDLSVDSKDEKDFGISTSQNFGNISVISDLVNVMDLDCFTDFDLVYDDVKIINNNVIASDIVFNSRVLQDYRESIGNRVLVIDDISGDFNSDPRATPYSVVDSFRLEDVRSRKFIIFARDKRFTDERQIYLVSLLHDGTFGYINQYGRVESDDVIGSFEFTIFDVEGRLLFYPNKFEVNDYDLSFLSYDVKDGFVGVGSTTFGNIVNVYTEQKTIIAGSTTTIASIPLDYRSSKLIIQIEDSNNEFYFNEISIINDGTDVSILEYGDFSTTIDSSNTVYVGFGTFDAYISGSNVNIDLSPFSGVNAIVNSAIISIASSITGYTDVGVTTFNTSKIESFYVSVASTSEYPVEIASYPSGFFEYNGGYGVVSIEDLDNNNYQISEYTVVSDSGFAYLSEYGVLYTSNEVGIITAFNTGSETKILFTPFNPSNFEIRTLSHSIGPYNVLLPFNEIDLTSYQIKEGFSEYEGTGNAVRRNFELLYKGDRIFQKEFLGFSTSIVLVDSDIIKFQEPHFFVTGENIKYTFNDFTSGPIGIATTTITGIGLTDILPENLYAIKLNDLEIKLAETAEDALKLSPISLKLSSSGIGTNHYLTSTNQNPKLVVTVDNMLQSPVVSTAVTSFLTESILTIDDVIPFGDNIRAFVGGDLIKINDEIMRVAIVGYGSTGNIFVNRPWLGTKLQAHAKDSVITKIVGNYNIVDNTINFASAPYGPKPISDQNNRPDSRDFSGITTYSTFSGRVFLRSGITDSDVEPYTFNYVLDDIADQFNGITTSFTLKSNGDDITDIQDSNAIIAIRDIFQTPSKGGIIPIQGSYSLEEVDEQTNILFTGNEYTDGVDIEVTRLPIGGRIVSVGSSRGFGYQSLVSAGGTAVVSISGTIQSISITNYGSGYRPGIQTYINVGVQTYSNETPNIEYIGYGIVDNGRIIGVAITNPGIGYTFTNPPKVVFDDPLSYSNLETVYSNTSIGSTNGRNAKVDIVVGQGSSVIDFELRDVGFGYQVNNVLTVSAGGPDGIPREYKGRYIDAANLLVLNKEFIKNEVLGYIIATYPFIILNPDYDAEICKRDIGYIVDAVSYDIAFGGNSKCVEAGNAYWSNLGINYVSGESLETISGYEYIVGISSYIINNVTVPISYQIGTIITQVKNTSIQFDEDCNPFNYSSNCCSDVLSAISNCVGIVTSIIGIGTSASPDIISPYSRRIVSLPTGLNFDEFRIFIDKIFNEEFTGWTIGDLELIDDISKLFDGRRRSFPIKFDGIQQSIKAKVGSQIDVQSTLLIFVNSILQVPGQSYRFNGGSIIRFTEPPRRGDTCTIIFYRGTGDVDVKEIDVLETIKKGDKVQIKSDYIDLIQTQRSVKEVIATDTVETYPYVGVGVVDDIDLFRPIKWCKQRTDLFIDGSYITKDRELYESLINPFTNIIYDIGAGTSVAYVESIRTFFDYKKENAANEYINSIDIYTQDSISAASARAIVGSSGSITEIIVDNGGFGYNTNPEVAVQNPILLDSSFEELSIFDLIQDSSRATATANVINGSVDTITVGLGGTGYSQENPPLVLVAEPKPLGETAFQVIYEGDFGSITGIATTIVGVSSLGIIFEFSIDENSPLRDPEILMNPVVQSGIKTDYYFVAKNTILGYGLTTLNNDLTSLISGYENIDNVYQVYELNYDPYIVSISEIIVNLVRYGSYIIDDGSTVIIESTGTMIVEDKVKVVSIVEDFNGLDFILPSFPEFESRVKIGNYTWGRISNMIRPYPESYEIYKDNGLIGISTSPIIRRTRPLRYQNYLP